MKKKRENIKCDVWYLHSLCESNKKNNNIAYGNKTLN